jgi:hypothetical protein
MHSYVLFLSRDLESPYQFPTCRVRSHDVDAIVLSLSWQQLLGRVACRPLSATACIHTFVHPPK